MTSTRYMPPCLALMLLAVSGLPALGQGFGPDAYGIPSHFGMAMPTPTRQLSMGTVMTCINDMHFANPGFAAGQSSPGAGVRLILTDLERGPSVTSVQAHYVHPLRPNHSGLQATWLALDSGDGSVVLPGLGPTPVSMYENALVVDYGVRVSKRLTVGLSVLGYQETGFRLGALAGPNLLDVRARADYGARAGAAFEYAPGDYVGALYSFSQTSVDASGLLMPGPIRTDFNGD